MRKARRGNKKKLYFEICCDVESGRPGILRRLIAHRLRPLKTHTQFIIEIDPHAAAKSHQKFVTSLIDHLLRYVAAAKIHKNDRLYLIS